jgi:hypothetical protein
VKGPVRIAAALAAIALGAPAAPALADGFTLDLAPQSEAVVGRPMIVQATGTIPAASVWAPYWFSLDAIPTTFTTTCPPDRWQGAQFAYGSGGGIVVLSQKEQPDTAGNFTIPVAVTPSAPGSVLLCGYTDDGEATTLATASLILDIQPAPSGAAAYAERGVRSCRKRFAGSRERSCIRAVLREANARCRRLGSPDARARCLQAVRTFSGPDVRGR